MNIKNRIMLSICHDGPASRTELAKKFKLSASHICEAVASLVEEGVLIELGYRMVKKARGRKNTLLDFNPIYKFALGIGFADGVLSIGLTTVKGDVLGKASVKIGEETSKEDVFNTCRDISMRLLRDSCLEPDSLLGVGLCIKLSSAERFYPDPDCESIISEVRGFAALPVVYDPAEEYLLLDERIADIRPEGLYLFGAAKVIRELLLYRQ